MYNTVRIISKMSHTKLTLITVILVALLLPVGLVQADTWIEDFVILSDTVPGENTSVMVTVGYDFSSQVQLNPGIFSFAADDWIVEILDPVNGQGSENYTLEFPTPEDDGVYYYQANVWYAKNNKWFFDGTAAAQNFTIQVGGEVTPQIEEFVSIMSISKPESVNVSSNIDMNITIQHSYQNLTEVSINIENADSEIIAEDFDSLEGVGSKIYQLSFASPNEAGLFVYTVNIDSETTTSTISASQGISIETIGDEEEDIPQIDEFLNIVELTTPESLNVSSTVNLNIILQHNFINWTEISIYIHNADSEIIVEETDSLNGVGTEEYSLSYIAPIEAGQHSYTVYVESEISNSTESSQEFSIETIAPIVEPPPPKRTPSYIIAPVILALAFLVYRYAIKKD